MRRRVGRSPALDLVPVALRSVASVGRDNHDDRCVSCVARALRFTTAETAALMMLGLRTEPDGQGGWLDPAVAHRAEIHQAAGMVSVQLDLSTAQALARMRAHAFVHNRLLIQVAHDVVARRLVFTQDME